MAQETPIFEIKIDFEKDSPNPARVFETMAGLIEALEALDRALLIPFGIDLEPQLLLEDIVAGSLKTKLASFLRSVDDEAIKSLDWKKLVGAYLVKAKYVILKYLEKHDEISSRAELLELTNEIQVLAEATDIKAIPAYHAIPPRVVLLGVEHITSSVSKLSSKDVAEYVTDGLRAEFNLDFVYKEEMREELLKDSEKTSMVEAILKVKKPDFLADSQWQFRYEGKIILANIRDHNWLLEYQTQKTEVRPGDAIRADLEIKIIYDEADHEVATHYNVLRVLEVLRIERAEVIDWIEEDDGGNG